MITSLLPWQQNLWQKMVTNKKPAHAYLLYGNKGVGKAILARQLSHYWLCLSPIGHQPCGHCKSCLLLLGSGAHPDIFHLAPQDSEFIKVDQVRDLVSFINQTSQLSTCKVITIAPAEALNLNAANALLKSLEEPAGSTHIILLSHHIGQLLPTIKSRCIQQLCPLPAKEEAIQWMKTQLPNVSQNELLTLWTLAGQAPLYAVTLYQQQVLAQRSQVVEDFKKLLKGQLNIADAATSWGQVELLLIIDWFCDWAHRIAIYQAAQTADYLGLEDMHKVLIYLAQKASSEQIMDLQQLLLIERQKVLAKSNLNKTLLLETLLIHWINILKTS